MLETFPRPARLVAAILAAALVTGACGSTVSPSPASSNAPSTGTSAPGPSLQPSASGIAGASSEASAEPSPSDSAEPGASEGPTPSADAATPVPPDPNATPSDVDLEMMFPDQVDDVVLTISSVKGPAVLKTATPQQVKAINQMLSRLKKKIADVSVATATDESGTLAATIVAYRINGTNSAALQSTYIAVMRSFDPRDLQVGSLSFRGKTYTTLTSTKHLSSGTSYLLVKGDALFIIQTPDQRLAQDVIAAWP